MITIAELRNLLANCPLPDDTHVAVQSGESAATSINCAAAVRTSEGTVILVLMSQGELIEEKELAKSKLN